MGFPLGMPLTLTLSPQAGRGDTVALVARGLPLSYRLRSSARAGSRQTWVSYEWGGALDEKFENPHHYCLLNFLR
jgi:hypothetical protein